MQLARTHRPQSRNRVLPAASSSVAIGTTTHLVRTRTLASYTRANKFAPSSASRASARARPPPFFRFVKMEGTVIAPMMIFVLAGDGTGIYRFRAHLGGN